MYRIGDFSRMSRVTVKALRHYDAVGLLRPSHVDDASGYRYYTAEQLPQLYRILALKDIGFSLEQIASLLQKGVAAQELHGMLRLRQAEIESKIQEEQERLIRVEARLKLMEQENIMANYDIVIKSVEPIRVVSVRDKIAAYPAIGALYGELYGFLRRNHIRPTGLAAAIYHDSEYKDTDIDAEAVLAIETAGTASERHQDDGKPWPATLPGIGSKSDDERIRIYELPFIEQAACTVHHGSFKTLEQAYQALWQWVNENNYKVCAPTRELHIYCGEGTVSPDDETYVTEIQFPVQKA